MWLPGRQVAERPEPNFARAFDEGLSEGLSRAAGGVAADSLQTAAEAARRRVRGRRSANGKTAIPPGRRPGSEITRRPSRNCCGVRIGGAGAKGRRIWRSPANPAVLRGCLDRLIAP